MKTNLKRIGFAILSFIILIVFDQWTKYLAVEHLMNKEPFIIIDGVFQLRYLENRGAAFGMMQGGKWFFLIVTAVAVIGLVWFLYKERKSMR